MMITFRFSSCKKGFKYFFIYKDDETVMPLKYNSSKNEMTYQKFY